jgi:hypothetical protein
LAGPPAVPSAPSAVSGPSAPPAAQDVVPITAFCYSGDAAIERALSLRDQVRAALADAASDGATIHDLIEEIFDLVQLGTGRTR